MKTFLSSALVVSLFAVTNVARADVSRVQQLDGASAVFLANHEVAQLLLESATGSLGTLFVGRIVTTTLETDSDRKSSSEVCIQLNWDGGDVIGTWGAITGRVSTEVIGRGVFIKVTDVTMERNADNDAAGRCQDPSQ